MSVRCFSVVALGVCIFLGLSQDGASQAFVNGVFFWGTTKTTTRRLLLVGGVLYAERVCLQPRWHSRFLVVPTAGSEVAQIDCYGASMRCKETSVLIQVRVLREERNTLLWISVTATSVATNT